MRIGIRAKFLLLISILLLLIFGTITVFQIRSNTRALRISLFEESKAFASLATEPIGNVFAIYKDSGTLKISQQIDSFLELNDSITNVAIVDVSGKTNFVQNKSVDIKVSQEEASAFEPIYKYGNTGALNTIIYPYFEASGAHRFTIVFSVSDEEIEGAIRDQTTQLIYFGVVSLAATMALVYLLINRFIIKPVKEVSEQAGVISAGNLEQQIEVHGHDEIASLGVSVNKMAESLKANIAELQEVDKVKTEFMMITSHNLRTPLSIIKGYLDNMNLVMDNPEMLMKSLTRMGSSVQRLEIFAEDILTISRFELGNSDLQPEKIKLEDFMKRIIDEFAPTAMLKEIKFESDVQDGDTEVSMSVPYIRSALWNLLDNAAKFTKKDGKITLIAKKVGSNVNIIVSDTGIGISPIEITKLFTKFHRGTSTLTYDFEGTGIGLYSSKVMVEKHGGTITVESNEGKGSTFTLILPLTPPSLSSNVS